MCTPSTFIFSLVWDKISHFRGTKKNLGNVSVRNVEMYLCHFGFQLLPAMLLLSWRNCSWDESCPAFLCEFFCHDYISHEPMCPNSRNGFLICDIQPVGPCHLISNENCRRDKCCCSCSLEKALIQTPTWLGITFHLSLLLSLAPGSRFAFSLPYLSLG